MVTPQSVELEVRGEVSRRRSELDPWATLMTLDLAVGVGAGGLTQGARAAVGLVVTVNVAALAGPAAARQKRQRRTGMCPLHGIMTSSAVS